MLIGLLLITSALLSAGLDWCAVALDKPQIEAIAKPMVMVLLAVAVAVGGEASLRWLVVVALLFSLIGDVALLERFDRFIHGLSAFLVSHIVYSIAFVVAAWRSPALGTLFVGVGLAALAALTVGRTIVDAARRSDDRLGLPVMVYVAVLSAMLAFAWFTTSLAAAMGATLFAASDGVLGWNRFVHQLRHGRLTTHLLYHAGQTLIAWWAIGL